MVVSVLLTYAVDVVVKAAPLGAYVLLLWDSNTRALAVPEPDFFQRIWYCVPAGSVCFNLMVMVLPELANKAP